MVELQNVSVQYGSFTAVKEVYMTMKEGEFFTFLGPSGCGKTTTLRAIAGFERVAQGKILLNGKDISGLLPEEHGIGFVFQNYALFPSMNVYENIAFGLKAHKTKSTMIRPKVMAVAEKTGITEHLNKKISELSGGQQQRIAIARALVMEPSILLMDEPLSNLDAKLRINMREEIKRLQKTLGITMLYVTHDQEEALAISDRIAVFNHGVVEQIGKPYEIYHHPQTEATAKFVGDTNEARGLLLHLLEQKLNITGKRLYIRPENIRVQKEAAGSDGIQAVVESFSFTGAFSKIHLQTSDSCLLDGILFHPDNSIQVGDSVYVIPNLSGVLQFEGV